MFPFLQKLVMPAPSIPQNGIAELNKKGIQEKE